jgi:pyruvate,water dikinase
LGELTAANVPVPPGFVVLSSAYFAFLDENHLRPEIHRILSACDINDSQALNVASDEIQKLIAHGKFPEEITREIFESYHQLGSDSLVAVRSSATAEDLPDASFAGQQESYLNVHGDANVILKIRECYESLFGSRSIFYRAQKNYDHFKVGIAVPVQKMVQSEVSGVMFSVDPITKDKDRLVIEGAFGLGDYIVQGVVTPDHYEVKKSTGEILIKQVNKQEIMEVRDTQGVKQVPVPVQDQQVQKLSDDKIKELADIGKRVQQHYLFPQDMEWAFAGGELYLTQARPITTLGDESTPKPTDTSNLTSGLTQILKGAPASPGLVSGPVRIVEDVKHLDKVKEGDIMVTVMTTPDFVPAMKRAAGIITDRGGLTSHAAIVSRELGVTCVVGTEKASKTLLDGQIVTINGNTGEVFNGALKVAPGTVVPPAKRELADSTTKTATHLYVNLAEPELAEKISKLHVDGVGLLRAEFMIAGIGVHPKKMIAEGKQAEYVDRLAEDMRKFCDAFNPRPVIYRATDFKTNEYRALKGGDLYEPEESNPMLGFRGAYRYIKSPEVFALELEAIKKVRNEFKLTNLWLMIPFVSTVKEMTEVKKLVVASGLVRTDSFKLFMMVEIPANVILLDDFLDTGIDGVSIGSNDLTMLTLGIDRDNSEVAPNFDERNPAVMWALEKTIRTCAKRGVMCGICGQAPSEYPELVEKLVEWGIYSISVNPDAIARTRDIIAASESRVIQSKPNTNG